MPFLKAALLAKKSKNEKVKSEPEKLTPVINVITEEQEKPAVDEVIDYAVENLDKAKNFDESAEIPEISEDIRTSEDISGNDIISESQEKESDQPEAITEVQESELISSPEVSEEIQEDVQEKLSNEAAEIAEEIEAEAAEIQEDVQENLSHETAELAEEIEAEAEELQEDTQPENLLPDEIAEALEESEAEQENIQESKPEEAEEFKLKYDVNSGERYVDTVSTKTEFDKMLDELSAISGDLLSWQVEKFAKQYTGKFQGDDDKAEADAKKYEAFLGGYITNAAMLLYDNGYKDMAIKRLEQAKSILEARKKLEDETQAIKTRVEEDDDAVDLSDILGLFGD